MLDGLRIPDLAGKPASAVRPRELERQLRDAILAFEPRLKSGTVNVRVDTDGGAMNHNAMVFFIEAELWAQPMPLRLFFRTQVDLETGNVDVTETSGGR